MDFWQHQIWWRTLNNDCYYSNTMTRAMFNQGPRQYLILYSLPSSKAGKSAMDYEYGVNLMDLWYKTENWNWWGQ